MNDIVWLTMRRMRTPLILLILVYFISVFAMTIVPGEDASGQPAYMNFLDAVYFVAIMATTIGFGEIPHPFTDAQRMLVFVIILPNVAVWLYSFGTILSLILDPQFKAVLARARFARGVRWLSEDFFVVCGFGNTGKMVVRGLLTRGLHPVILEQNEETVHRMLLDDDFAHLPALGCDTTDRRNLEMAGIHQPNCRGVIVTTNEDHANLTIAITTKLLAPRLPVFARSENERVSANLASFGTDYVINPYAIFAERLYLALTSPIKYLVQDWLISVPGSELRELLEPPTGRWIVCGAGRFGSRMLTQLEAGGLPFTVVEVHPERLQRYPHGILGRGTEADTLEQAGIHDAVGIIAGTGDDVDNLSIVMTAKELNPGLFVVARQERPQNDALFEASGADLVAKRSLIVARRILAVATTPLLQTFMQHLVQTEESFAVRTAEKLKAVLDSHSPNLWVADLRDGQAAGMRLAHAEGIRPQLRHLIQDTRSESGQPLDCVCLVLERGARRMFLPEPDLEILEGDRMLFAGQSHARIGMERALFDPVLLMDVATPERAPRSAIWRWLR